MACYGENIKLLKYPFLQLKTQYINYLFAHHNKMFQCQAPPFHPTLSLIYPRTTLQAILQVTLILIILSIWPGIIPEWYWLILALILTILETPCLHRAVWPRPRRVRLVLEPIYEEIGRPKTPTAEFYDPLYLQVFYLLQRIWASPRWRKKETFIQLTVIFIFLFILVELSLPMERSIILFILKSMSSSIHYVINSIATVVFGLCRRRVASIQQYAISAIETARFCFFYILMSCPYAFLLLIISPIVLIWYLVHHKKRQWAWLVIFSGHLFTLSLLLIFLFPFLLFLSLAKNTTELVLLEGFSTLTSTFSLILSNILFP